MPRRSRNSREVADAETELRRLRTERDQARAELLRVLRERNELRRARDALIDAMASHGLAVPEQPPAKYETDNEPRYDPEADDER